MSETPPPGPIVIGVAGGSGSGKTTVVREIVRGLGRGQVTVIHHDWYYRDTGDMPLEERSRINYDHPDSLETGLLVRHLRMLLRGEPIEVPRYDFTHHARLAETETALPRKVVILDGLLILWDQELRRLMDIKVFVDTDSDVRFIRRLSRDLRERALRRFGDRAVRGHRAPDAPRVRRAEQALRGPDRARGRPEPGGRGHAADEGTRDPGQLTTKQRTPISAVGPVQHTWPDLHGRAVPRADGGATQGIGRVCIQQGSDSGPAKARLLLERGNAYA